MKTKTQFRHSIKTGRAIALCLLSLGLQAACADEQEKRGQLSAGDYKFMTEAVEGGRLEITLGQLASRKATAPAVIQFGELMVRDHQKANQELTQLATQKGATLPEAASKKEDKLVERLQALSGTEFDQAYIKAMVNDHKQDVKDFQKAAEKSDDAELKAWVAKTLPTLQEHLSQAQSVESQVVAAK